MDNLLPKEIKLEIFSRLPAESVLQCKQVCKSWRKLLHHPQFAHMHLRRSLQLGNVGILYIKGWRGGFDIQLYYGEYDENDEESYKTHKRINHPRVTDGDNVVNSCNGLICFALSSKYSINDYIYICNPITREYVNLPKYDIDDIKERYTIYGIAYGFGYLPSTNEYKVVRIMFHCDETQSSVPVGFVEVYTLGSGSGWRNKGEIMHVPSHRFSVLANEALNWLDDQNMQIVVFDLADEEFRLLPLPPCFVPGDDHSYQLKLLGGLLCLVDEKFRERVIDVWSFKKANLRNTTSTCVMKEQEYLSWSWHKEFSMAWEDTDDNPYDLFACTKSGEVLLWSKMLGVRFSDKHRHSILSLYDPKAATLKKFDTDMIFLDAFPHLNSLVSLKAIGEEDAKIIGSAEEVIKPDLSWQDEGGFSPAATARVHILGDGRRLFMRRRLVMRPQPYWVVEVKLYHPQQ